MTTSCTHSLEMSALLSNIGKGDEVIMPSFTFVSTANAFRLRGANIRFVDIRPDTFNIDENKIEEVITKNTKAIVVVHYAGVGAELDPILDLAKKYNILVIEDSAQGLMAKYKDRPLGSIGDLGCFSFHQTKNYQCGEGGALVINREIYYSRAEILREKGTNRSSFLRAEVDKYSWVDCGSSYILSELQASFLYSQFEQATMLKQERLKLWNRYWNQLSEFNLQFGFKVPFVPPYCNHNAHTFALLLNSAEERRKLQDFLLKNGVQANSHYVPLHSSPYGKENAEFIGEDEYTTSVSERLLRLPLFNGLGENEVDLIVSLIKSFYI